MGYNAQTVPTSGPIAVVFIMSYFRFALKLRCYENCF